MSGVLRQGHEFDLGEWDFSGVQVARMELVPNADELAIVLRGDLAAILTFACGKRNPDLLEQTAVLEELMGEAAVSVSCKRQKPLERGSLVSQVKLVAGA
jgi:hypothetical protein